MAIKPGHYGGSWLGFIHINVVRCLRTAVFASEARFENDLSTKIPTVSNFLDVAAPAIYDVNLWEVCGV